MSKTFRRTAIWCVLFLLAGGAGAGAFVYWKLAGVNEEIRRQLLADLAEKCPNWVVSVDRVRFDWNRTIHVYGFTLRPRGDDVDLATIPEVRITIDREQFDRDEVVDVQRMHLLKPNVLLDRNVDGEWNWQRLLPLASEERTSLPEWVVDDATIRVRLRHAGGDVTELPVATSRGRIVPSGKRRFQVTGDIVLEGTGTFDLDGELDVDRKQWSFAGRARDLVSGERLFEVATRASPEVQVKLAQFDSRLQGWLPDREPGGEGVRVADASNDPVRAVGEARRVAPPTLGIDGRLALEFRVEQPGPDAEIEFSVQAEFDGAKVDHPALPFPLHDVDGRIVWGNRRFVVEGFRARNGVTRVQASGRVEHEPTPRGSFEIEMTDVVLDDRLRSRLTGRIRQVYDRLDPTGRANFSTKVVVDEQGVRTEDLNLSTKEAEGAFDEFPYRYERISGGVRQEGRDLVVTIDGFAGRVPVAVRGRVRDFTGANDVTLVVSGKGLPIDEQFLQACKPDARQALRALRASGNTDFTIHCRRPGGLDTDWRTGIEAKLLGVAIECTAFPYRCRSRRDADVRLRRGHLAIQGHDRPARRRPADRDRPLREDF